MAETQKTYRDLYSSQKLEINIMEMMTFRINRAMCSCLDAFHKQTWFNGEK